jgi:hypothetical protein
MEHASIWHFIGHIIFLVMLGYARIPSLFFLHSLLPFLHLIYRVPTLPPPLHVATAGKNHLNEEITPLLPTGIGERYGQTISNLGHAALLRRCELSLETKVLN